MTLKTPSAVRTRLYLTGDNAPKGGPLVDTKTFECEGAAGTLVCSAAYQALPQGTYKFRILVSGSQSANVTLTVRW